MHFIHVIFIHISANGCNAGGELHSDTRLMSRLRVVNSVKGKMLKTKRLDSCLQVPQCKTRYAFTFT